MNEVFNLKKNNDIIALEGQIVKMAIQQTNLEHFDWGCGLRVGIHIRLDGGED